MTAAATAPQPLSHFCPWAGEDGVQLYLRPLGLAVRAGAAEYGLALSPLAGGPLGFALLEVIARDPLRCQRAQATVEQVLAWGQQQGAAVSARLEQRLAALTRPRAPFGGLTLDRPRIMAVLNVTPDSFSDGGDFLDPAQAIARGEALLAAGADLLDIGGESSRPGAEPVTPEEELRRILPVVHHFAGRGVPLSIDSYHAPVLRAALAAGATIINDITGLTGDPATLPLACERQAPVMVMHMQGQPATMQEQPHYRHAALDVYDWLERQLEQARRAGLTDALLAADPGIGFGKTTGHNLEILRHTALYHGLGVALVLGISRKRLIAALSRGEPPRARLPGSLAAGLEIFNQGGQFLRVHDVAETAQARAVWQGLHGGG